MFRKCNKKGVSILLTPFLFSGKLTDCVNYGKLIERKFIVIGDELYTLTHQSNLQKEISMSIEKEVLKEEYKKHEVLIRGWFKDSFKENHRLPDGAVIFESRIQTISFWKNVMTEITVQIDGRCLKKFNHQFVEGEFVELRGEFRTKNVFDDDGHKIQRKCYVFIKDIELIDEEQKHPKNYVCVSGILARKGKIHHCKNGDCMFDFTVDIRRSYGRRSSIPCVIWGNERVQILASVEKNTKIEVEGLIKTRIITDSAGITKSVSEIIVDNFKI